MMKNDEKHKGLTTLGVCKYLLIGKGMNVRKDKKDKFDGKTE